MILWFTSRGLNIFPPGTDLLTLGNQGQYGDLCLKMDEKSQCIAQIHWTTGQPSFVCVYVCICILIYIYIYTHIPVVPHKAVAEVSKIGNL